jgi:hypothetical protein
VVSEPAVRKERTMHAWQLVLVTVLLVPAGLFAFLVMKIQHGDNQ